MEITHITRTAPPLEMWVEGNTAWQYKGFDIVDYEAPPSWLTGVWSGRAKIRKQGGPTTYRYSPELVALHQAVCRAIEQNYPPMFSGTKSRRVTPASKEFREAHHRLFDDLPQGLDYHGTLMQPAPGGSLEDVQEKVVRALESLASEARPAKAFLQAIADEVRSWVYKKVGKS